ncbi:YbdK family carboxylate-amine ligase [soil metagenome]
MNTLPFKPSTSLTLGCELELQIINPRNFHLMARAKEFIRRIRSSHYAKLIKPEVTQSMIEINSSVQQTPAALLMELLQVKTFMLQQAEALNICFAGGGTHPFQMWKYRKIFPAARFRKLSRHYGYLAKRYTVFAQHLHIGCISGDDAIYLVRALARYIPQLIVLSASSPFYQGVDTTFDSTRTSVVNSFPTSGYMPVNINNWEEFSNYYQKLCELKIIESMKDIYWDVRPKPEFGTVEVRVYDTPLTMERAAMLAAYTQTLVHYLLHERVKTSINSNSYAGMLYAYNRYQASRYGFDGDFIEPITLQHGSIIEDMLTTITLLEPHAKYLGNSEFLAQVLESAKLKQNDAKWLRDNYLRLRSLRKLVQEQTRLWAEVR